jgi:hypothetical protein
VKDVVSTQDGLRPVVSPDAYLGEVPHDAGGVGESLGRVGGGQPDDARAGGESCLDPRGGVLEDDAFGWGDAERACAGEVAVGGRLSGADAFGGDQDARDGEAAGGQSCPRQRVGA